MVDPPVPGSSAARLSGPELVAPPPEPVTSTRPILERVAGLFEGVAPIELASVCLLVVVLMHANESLLIRLPASALAVLGLISPRARLSAAFWWGLSGVLVVGYALDWDIWIVNHKYMMTYVCVAMACARSSAEPAAALRGQARLLLGLCFLFATAWKVGSAEFRSGDFFYATLLTDSRFSNVAELLAGVPAEGITANVRALASLVDPHSTPDGPIALIGGPRVDLVALVLTWWTIAIEATLAAVFLWPGRSQRSQLARHGVLLLFLVSTFPIATVQGFAALLAILGLAICAPTERRTALAYAAIFVLLPLFDLPFVRLGGALFDGP